MRMPEKTILGASAVLMTLSSWRVLVQFTNGRMSAHMHAAVASAGSPRGFMVGYVTGFSLVLAIKLLATLGLWALLLRSFRKDKAPA